jgi:DNA repair exonuclease SbcCD nuclease subunit
MQKKFIHFGCWNQGYCDKTDEDNKTPISEVMRQLEKTIKAAKTKHDFIVVAGDNYYPNKPEKKEKTEKKDKTEKSEKTEKKVKEGKTIIQGNLESGFNCLPSGIEINIILGNHDLETSTK